MNPKHCEGKPCKKCGRTLRYVNHPSKACVNCFRSRYIGEPKILPEHDRNILLELRQRHGLRLQDLAVKFELPVYWVKRNLESEYHA
jgi:hypothetical protein